MTDEKVVQLAEKIFYRLPDDFAEEGTRWIPEIAAVLRECHALGRRDGLEEAAKLACQWCRDGKPMSSEPDLVGTYHNIGTAADLDYRLCHAAEIRKLAIG